MTGHDRAEAVAAMTAAVWPDGKWSAEAECMLDAILDFLIERVDEIEGTRLRLGEQSNASVWLHTQSQVQSWLRDLNDPNRPT